MQTLCILSNYFSTDHLKRWNLVKNRYKKNKLYLQINNNFTFLLKVIKNVKFINIKT